MFAIPDQANVNVARTSSDELVTVASVVSGTLTPKKDVRNVRAT